ncbi:Peroxisomal membrane protein [Actinidia chinensis var. chinensis]|uniref:Peroxisomal membrane protein PEX14 n=1 Tax=Actinidia chinensis var. chinensis TaxID=1590841 RepID=A0A2R6PE07_ACTCC|nr:Peroxisomal membrane protein [Actinidia chinensis var. chinensis]
MREEQVQNAVKFLSHPKVKGSPVMYRRSFLERKGLTKEEIDEAFRRVPDPPQNVSNAQPAGTNQDGQVKPLSSVQPQVATQILQPSAAAPAGVISTLTRSRFHWSHALLAVGFLALSGAGTAVLFKKSVVPRLKSWIRKVVFEEEEGSAKTTDSKPSLQQEAAAAAKTAAAAAADVARASQEMLLSKREEEKYFKELMNLIGMQVQEMKSMSNAIQKLEGNTHGRTPLTEQDHRVSAKSLRQPNANGNVDFDSYSARSSPPPATVEPSAAPHPKSYMEIMAMVQRGEKPPNIREINDLPPNPNQPLPNPHSAPRAKPWEVGQTQTSYSQVLQSHESTCGLNSNLQDNGFVNQLNGDSSVPWWQKKNVRITEIENEDELKRGSSGVLTNERPVQRSWVPPQPPPVAMPEAAAAIRQPKKTLSEKQVADDQLVADPSDAIDELQRITKISESGGVVDANGGSSGLSKRFSESGVDTNGMSSGLYTSEIQEEQEAY